MENQPTPNQSNKIQIIWDFDLPNPDDLQAHDEFAQENGVPTVVDLSDYFNDPDSVSNDQITDALSDEHGWLVLDWDNLEACNTDNNDGMINQQPQPINPEEDNMENSTTQTPNTEVPMNSQDLITQLFNQFTQDGGSPKVTEFKRHIDMLIKSEIKPLCGRTAKAADGSDWRSLLKAQFGGRGAKWVKLPISNLEASLDGFDNDGIDTKDYRAFIEQAGFAWIRFSGARVNNGVQSAAFEVRVGGSTIDHPKQLHYIPVNDIDDVIEPLRGTPHSMKLEVMVKPETEETTDEELDATTDLAQEVVEAAIDAPEEQDLDTILADFNNDEFEEDEDLFAEI